ncbi:unnamed protein product, partial [Ectocarpus fasciculatus]
GTKPNQTWPHREQHKETNYPGRVICPRTSGSTCRRLIFLPTGTRGERQPQENSANLCTTAVPLYHQQRHLPTRGTTTAPTHVFFVVPHEKAAILRQPRLPQQPAQPGALFRRPDPEPREGNPANLPRRRRRRRGCPRAARSPTRLPVRRPVGGVQAGEGAGLLAPPRSRRRRGSRSPVVLQLRGVAQVRRRRRRRGRAAARRPPPRAAEETAAAGGGGGRPDHDDRGEEARPAAAAEEDGRERGAGAMGVLLLLVDGGGGADDSSSSSSHTPGHAAAALPAVPPQEGVVAGGHRPLRPPLPGHRVSGRRLLPGPPRRRDRQGAGRAVEEPGAEAGGPAGGLLPAARRAGRAVPHLGAERRARRGGGGMPAVRLEGAGVPARDRRARAVHRRGGGGEGGVAAQVELPSSAKEDGGRGIGLTEKLRN